jgi:hypothetical protein
VARQVEVENMKNPREFPEIRPTNVRACEKVGLAFVWGVFSVGLLLLVALRYSSESVQLPVLWGVLLVFAVLFFRFLPRYVIAMLLLSLPLSLLGWKISQGAFGPERILTFFRDPELGLTENEERLRVSYNRAADIRGFEKSRVINRRELDVLDWLESREIGGLAPVTTERGSVLYYTLPRALSGTTRRTRTVSWQGAELEIILFPSVMELPLEPIELALWYLKELSRGVASPELSELYYSGRGAGEVLGLWRSPVPKAAGLFLAAATSLTRLIEGGQFEPGEYRCALRELNAIPRKLGRARPPELLTAFLNNLAVAELVKPGAPFKERFRRATALLKRAAQSKTEEGRIAKLNLIRLDQAFRPSRISRSAR